MIKLSHILTGALVASALMFADWATAAPLSASRVLSRGDQMAPLEEQTEQSYETPAQFKRQIVPYHGSEAPGTIIIDTGSTFLYLVQPGAQAIRYGIGVGRDGFRWQGVQHITKKAEWPDWTPPPEMIARQPYLPRFMAGGPTNPLGARAMYLGNTVYRIHGTNAPSTIGQRVSSGCIRLTNEDVMDLASRVNIGTKVVVINSADHRAESPLTSAPVSLRLR
ncbi:MAG: L,D-transpeptidase [Alphaproteobacteria bacterium]|nr:L,D-transpeptidase [Alphaproteobacteria bacterium]